ncbi:PAP2 superfamily-domain-containing protein [Pyronema omphalodes]|nr:PAP2 superfamily-domain-containing protein [Pyronema omphalodes]
MGADAFIEPLVVAGILTFGVLINRRRKDVSILQAFWTDPYGEPELPDCQGVSPATSTALIPGIEPQWRKRDFFKWTIKSRNTARWKDKRFSRFLAKFPFLIEVWYWLLVYWIYQLGRAFTAVTLSADITPIARLHGLSLIAWEEALGIFVELDIQHWFLKRPILLKMINCIYSFIHIPGTILFLAWLYYYAPRRLFEARRRTLALCNLLAFIVFTSWPCMPPRLLPEEDGYGFVDTVHVGKVSSVWTSNRFCQQLAAMPSLHFGYSFVIGLTLATMPNIKRRWLLVTVGIAYPAIILIAILATANHYVLDAIVGCGVAVLGWCANGLLKNLLPLEDTLYYLLRVHKPTLGERDGSVSPGDPKVGDVEEWWRQA